MRYIDWLPPVCASPGKSNPRSLVQGMMLLSTEPHWPGLSCSSFFLHTGSLFYFMDSLVDFCMFPDPGLNLKPWQLIFYCNILIPINIPREHKYSPPPPPNFNKSAAYFSLELENKCF